MPTVIRAVRLPEISAPALFEVSLPKNANIFKTGSVFAGAVSADGEPIPAHALFILTDSGAVETETRRFVAADLASGLDDLSSAVPELPGLHYRFISDLANGLMLFESLDPPLDAPLPETDVTVLRI